MYGLKQMLDARFVGTIYESKKPLPILEFIRHLQMQIQILVIQILVIQILVMQILEIQILEIQLRMISLHV